MEKLDPRKTEILRAIVAHYVRSGEPVGSKTLVDRYSLEVSPATVRNEMGALEEAGLIYQPHTSAGRVPTDAGYRMFVDAMARTAKLPAAQARMVQRFFGEPRWELEEALRQTAALLSHLTDQAAVVFAPALDRSVIRHVELVGLSGDRAMVVIVSDTGRVENHVIRIDEGADDVQLSQTAEMLNKIIEGALLESAAVTIRSNIDKLPLEFRDTAIAVSHALDDELSGNEGERVFLEGTSTMVKEEKFHDLDTVRQVIGALEHRRLVLEMLAEGLASSGVSVRIGTENSVEEMQACAVVTAPYGAEGNALGSLGVVGPTRMDYGKNIAAVYEVANHLGRMLTELGI